MRLRATAAALCLLVDGRAAIAQTAAPATDSDPTRPVLFSIRPEFFSIDDGVWRLQVVNRYDAALWRNRRWLGGRRGMLLRFEAPISTTETPATGQQAGLGDMYGQMLTLPRLAPRFAFAVGTGLSIPTATGDALGSGKWMLAPVAVPVWFFSGGLFYVKAQNFLSIAGDRDRPDVNFLLITPTVIRKLGRASWVLADTETKTDWRRDRLTGVKSGLQIGHIVARGFGVWVKPEVWWGANQDGRWNLKTGIVWYR